MMGLRLPKSIHNQVAVRQQVLNDSRVGSDGCQVDALQRDGLIVSIGAKTTRSSG